MDFLVNNSHHYLPQGGAQLRPLETAALEFLCMVDTFHYDICPPSVIGVRLDYPCITLCQVMHPKHLVVPIKEPISRYRMCL